jgi:hypothetical protein
MRLADYTLVHFASGRMEAATEKISKIMELPTKPHQKSGERQ